MLNFVGALQPVKPSAKKELEYEALPRICGKGRCEDHDDAKEQLKQLYKREYPKWAQYVDDEHRCFGGVFVFDCTPYELMEKAADETSKNLIQAIYEDAVELAPFVYE